MNSATSSNRATHGRQRIVILGGGPAGYEAALVAAELAAEVTIVSDEGLGGNSVLWDCVPSKALIVAAEAMDWVHTADALGVHLASGLRPDRNVVDFPKVATNVLALGANQSRDIERRVAAGEIRVVRGRGRLSGSHEVTVALSDGGSEVLPADYVLIGTGSTARVLPFFEPDGERVLVGQQLYGLPEVPERLIVVGSGATGAEFANAFTRFGSEVTLVSSRDLILPTEDPDAAQVIESSFERRGMTILRNARAVGCERRGDEVVVTLKDGSEVVGSHVLFTVGQVPSSGDLGLETVGVEVNAWGGIDVDAVGRTSCRWVYAAGDVVGRVMLASVAAMQGRTAMWHALGQAVQPIRWDAVAATIFTDPEVATVGMSSEDAAQEGVPIETARLDFRSNPRAKMIHGTDGFVKVHAQIGSGTVVGGVVVASRASDLIQPLAVAVQNRLTVAQVAQTITVYPSMTGSVAEAARMLMARLDA
ncbi:NAD(P)H-quinone dehydrogenase [Nitriliruptor alkaliphilus]|uniref:NAD(P)H-quinone dehydrogenase n=1 Tax=Nitriliruptor alkaliphilus TaxID=427918 RepID=UPI000A983231|nr:NAD(P)H-quinone dehydrogenase [Nitriliruptor alkaliphilus]